MHDQRQPRVAGNADMAAKAFALPVQRLRQAVVVQPGLTDGDDLGMRGQPRQFLRGRVRRIFVVRVHAHRGPQIRPRFDERHQGRPFRHVDADDQRVGHLVGGHPVKNGRQIGGKLGEIQMAVGINVHGESE
ncbi:hypothetical protein D9M68_783480 [compost metagenome]